MAHTLFSFFGRTGRGGLWLAVIISFLVVVAGFFAAYFLLGPFAEFFNPDGTSLAQEQMPDENTNVTYNWPSIALAGLAYLVGLWINLAASVKRCHDRGKSGWWMLLVLIPIVGGIWWLIDLGVLEGDQGPNKYGPDPSASAA